MFKSSSLVSVLFREEFSASLHLFFHLPINGFSVIHNMFMYYEWTKKINHTLAIDSTFQTFAVELVINCVD